MALPDPGRMHIGPEWSTPVRWAEPLRARPTAESRGPPGGPLAVWARRSTHPTKRPVSHHWAALPESCNAIEAAGRHILAGSDSRPDRPGLASMPRIERCESFTTASYVA